MSLLYDNVYVRSQNKVIRKQTKKDSMIDTSLTITKYTIIGNHNIPSPSFAHDLSSHN